MSALTKIQWCHHTYNPWRGCRKVAAECANCYISSTPPFRMTGQRHGSERVRAGAGYLAEPLKWNRAAAKAGERHRVFCLSLGDWLDDENVPIEWLAGLLSVVKDTPNLDWLLLTKRPQNWLSRIEGVLKAIESTPEWRAERPTRQASELRDWLADWAVLGKPRENVWIGVSAGADQSAALAIPARVHFLSAEPMLGPLDNTTHAAKFDWIILGGESGPKARPCDVGWIRAGVDFCRSAGVACYVKQLGARPMHPLPVAEGYIQHPGEPLPVEDGFVPEPLRLAHPKGGDPEEWPEDLRVREFPTV